MFKALKNAFSSAKGGTPSWEEDRSRFFRAIKKDDTKAMQEIAARHPDCVGWTSDKGSPLAVAIKNGSGSALAALIRFGANVNEDTGQGGAPLHVAVAQGRGDFTDALIDAGASLDTVYSFFADIGSSAGGREILMPLAVAIQKNDKDMIKRLADKGADLNVICCNQYCAAFTAQYTALDYARALKRFELADFIAALEKTKSSAPTPAAIASSAPPELAMILQAPVKINAPLRLRMKAAATL